MNYSKTVFVDIDTQNDFLDIKGNMYVAQSSGIRRNIGKLAEYAISRNITIISTMDSHFERDVEFWLFKPHCIPGEWGWQKIPETSYQKFQYIEPQSIKKLKIKSNIIVIEKQKISPFSNPNTLQVIKTLKKDNFVVFGVSTDFAVKEFTLRLLKENFSVQLVTDAIKGINEFQAALSIQEMLDNGAKLVRTREIISK